MTLALLEEIGVETSFEGNLIKVSPKAKVAPTTLVVESDWSSASYFMVFVHWQHQERKLLYRHIKRKSSRR